MTSATRTPTQATKSATVVEPVPKADSKTNAATVIGAIALIALGVFMYYLLRQVAVDELTWSRNIFVYGGLEAIALAAAGYFFGKEVNRERADKAEAGEAKAINAAVDAVQVSTDADTRLLALHSLIKQKQQSRAKAPSVSRALQEILGRSGGGDRIPDEVVTRFEAVSDSMGAAVPDTDWEELASFADDLVNGRVNRS